MGSTISPLLPHRWRQAGSAPHGTRGWEAGHRAARGLGQGAAGYWLEPFCSTQAAGRRTKLRGASVALQAWWSVLGREFFTDAKQSKEPRWEPQSQPRAAWWDMLGVSGTPGQTLPAPRQALLPPLPSLPALGQGVVPEGPRAGSVLQSGGS